MAATRTGLRPLRSQRGDAPTWVKQRQEGFSAAVLRLPTGDITAEQMLVVADLAERYSNGNVRTTIGQNLIVRWVSDGQVEAFYQELEAHGLGQPGGK